VKDPQTGEVVELKCTYDPETRGGYAPDGRQVKATLHWVSAAHSLTAEVRLYDRLFTKPNPDEDKNTDFLGLVNPNSLETLKPCRLEPGLAKAAPGSLYQFERQGYFCVDTKDWADGAPVFNRTVTLRDPWAKLKQAEQK